MTSSFLGACLALTIVTSIGAQSYPTSAVVSVGYRRVDSAASLSLPFVDSSGLTALRANGTIATLGTTAPNAPALPPGVTYVEVANGYGFSLARRSDGQVVAWGDNQYGQCNVPPLPAGVTWVSLAKGGYSQHVAAVRSDGVLVAWGANNWGQCNVPGGSPTPSWQKTAVGFRNTAALRSNGTLLVLGNNSEGMNNVPPLPAGVTYVDVAIGGYHILALRSNGTVVSWGYWAQPGIPYTNIPSLPAGMTYVGIAAGYDMSLLLRSDGQILVLESSTSAVDYVVGPAPNLPPGVTYTKVSSGFRHAVAQRSDGGVVAWGGFYDGPNDLPHVPTGTTVVDVRTTAYGPGGYALRDDGEVVAFGKSLAGQPLPPAGTSWRAIACGGSHALALASNGTVHGWGDNTHGQRNVPALPPGLTYTHVACGLYHSLLLRSDGNLVAFGYAFDGQCNVPPLPPGTSYVQADAGLQFSVARRSDGAVVKFGSPAIPNVPVLPAGLAYTQVSASATFFAARRSDGQIFFANAPFAAPPPSSIYDVEVVAARAGDFALIRRSDGTVLGIGGNLWGQTFVPPPPTGRSYVGMAAGESTSMLRVGSTSTYVRSAVGCAGTSPASRLVPEDTPHIGRALRVHLRPLPLDVAIMVTGFAGAPALPPLDLTGFGAPACFWRIGIDLLETVIGANQSGVSSLLIPDDPLLVGVSLFQQALVFDNANPLGLVVSDAATMVIGGH